MKLSVKKFAALTGVSVRTLHHYDHIGLLSPDWTDAQTGYRYYGPVALTRMQEILFYRELDFPLAAIRDMLAAPHYDRAAALGDQKRLLLLKKKRLEALIAAIERAEEGDTMTDFTAFDHSAIDRYKEETRQRWGHTDAYRESEQRGVGEATMAEGMDAILVAFATAKQAGAQPDDATAQALVERLQLFITRTQYTCTLEILHYLGEMYVEDERFRHHIDRYGEGTAAFIRQAIVQYSGV